MAELNSSKRGLQSRKYLLSSSEKVCLLVIYNDSSRRDTGSTEKNINYYPWMKNVACHINKQRLLQPSSHEPPATVYPEGIQDGEK